MKLLINRTPRVLIIASITLFVAGFLGARAAGVQWYGGLINGSANPNPAILSTTISGTLYGGYDGRNTTCSNGNGTIQAIWATPVSSFSVIWWSLDNTSYNNTSSLTVQFSGGQAGYLNGGCVPDIMPSENSWTFSFPINTSGLSAGTHIVYLEAVHFGKTTTKQVSFTVNANTVGTVVVNSKDTSGNFVSATWSFTQFPGSDPCASGCSGTSKTYTNIAAGSYTIKPGSPPPGYSFAGVKIAYKEPDSWFARLPKWLEWLQPIVRAVSVNPSATQTLAAGGTITFDIVWTPQGWQQGFGSIGASAASAGTYNIPIDVDGYSSTGTYVGTVTLTETFIAAASSGPALDSSWSPTLKQTAVNLILAPGSSTNQSVYVRNTGPASSNLNWTCAANAPLGIYLNLSACNGGPLTGGAAPFP